MTMDRLNINMLFTLVIIIGLQLFTPCFSEEEGEENVCLGTTRGKSHSGNAADRYDGYRKMYQNCTFLNGNLEITFLDEEDNYNLSFLSTIKEVTGYVLISFVHTEVLPLTSLRIIRGSTLFNPDKSAGGDEYYSLYIDNNFKTGSDRVGLRELHFNSLYEIMEGSVIIFNNYRLCYADTIDWEDILSGDSSRYHYRSDNSTGHSSLCQPCNASCEVRIKNERSNALEASRHCWSEGPNMCQKLTKRTCSLQCYSRCFGEMPSECCSAECAGGCIGPTARDCWACKNFKNGDDCVPFCPRLQIYDKNLFRYVTNPDAKYAYGTLCVDKCPGHLVVDNQGCVLSCGVGRVADPDTKVCKECDGPCPKTCEGLPADKWVDASNIKSFENCTVVEGSINIMKPSFDGDPYYDIGPLHPSNFSVFETVREITGFLKVQGEHDEFTSLSFFKNLTIIHGRQLDSGFSIFISRTALHDLGLAKLKLISRGNVLIYSNPYLCYASSIRWPFLEAHQMSRIVTNKDPNECRAENRICSDQCSDDGCWGEGDHQCLSCRNFLMGERCVASCDLHRGVYQVNNSCQRCHEECLSSCSGPNADSCDECKNYRDGPFCVSNCPASKYPDKLQECQDCHDFCAIRSTLSSCTGPRNNIGEGACKACDAIEIRLDGNITQCLDPQSQSEDCKAGYYRKASKQYYSMKVCAQCDPLCTECFGSGPGNCDKCLYLREEGRCVSNCSSDHFLLNDLCVKCHDRCNSCYGPTLSDCYSCKQYKIYLNGKKDKFNCTETCPSDTPARVVERDELGNVIETVCEKEPVADETGPKKILPVVGAILGTLVFIAVVVLMSVVFCQRRARALESKERLAARMSGMCDDSEITPLTPTTAKPDMAILRLIKESTLRKGTMVGSGAFGTVYKGFWIPEGENVKVPVAIKFLQEGTSANQNRELLEEARVMASVNNRYCVPVIGVCMTAQMMLVTPYMPLGCLLDYVRKNQENIGSKALLDWCAQIASGMHYLEERGIVHRDLAARNVLVQNPKRVRVTDFGLAKLLDYNEEVFHASGGKMPIKWLALECILYRVFTHKSDVWSFGVTMWELFTYGQRPYENIRARDIPELLEKGERLPQPPICTIDVYMMMIKCWMLDAQSRPSFKELAEEFSKMARDPGRYLVIEGDRLMRLPSHAYDKQVFRNMSVAADGPEEIVEAEDYLMPSTGGDETAIGEGSATPPHHRHHHGHSHRSQHHPNGRLEKVKEESGLPPYDNDRARGGGGIAETSIDSEIPVGDDNAPTKYSSLEAAAAQRKQRAEAAPSRDSHKSRYSSDPCRLIGPQSAFSPLTEEQDFPTAPAPPTPIDKQTFALEQGSKDLTDGADSKRKQQQVPVDEDDYLQPSKTSHNKYMDLVNDDYLPPSPSHKATEIYDTNLPPPPPDPPGFDPSQNMFAENPEYFDEMDNSGAAQPLMRGVNHAQKLAPSGDAKARALSRDSESAYSEHDYYNDTDKLTNKSGAKKKGTIVNPSRTNPSVKYVV